MKVLFFLALLTGCGFFETHETKDAGTDPRAAELRTAYELRLDELKRISDPQTGWPDVRDCDGTLWAGLACAAGAPVQIELAEYEAGKIGRRPLPACQIPEESRSSVSKDMILGYLDCAWSTGNYQALVRLAAYGEAHELGSVAGFPTGWVMGEPYPEMASRVVLTPNGVGLIGRMLHVMSLGADDRRYRAMLPVYTHVDAMTYEGHLEALGILLQGQVRERARKGSLDAQPAGNPETTTPPAAGLLDVNGAELDLLAGLAASDPKNPLYAAVLGVYTGDMGPAYALLLDPATPCPAYVGDNPAFCQVHWLKAAKTVLERTK